MFPLLIMTLPIITAITCSAVLLSFREEAKDRLHKDLFLSLLTFYGLISVNWTYGLLYIYQLDILSLFDAVIYFTYLAVQVVLYRFTYIMTRLSGDPVFSWKHYILPVGVLLVTAIWSIFITEDKSHSNHLAYHAWVNARYAMRFVFSLVYSILSIRRIMRYRREIESYSANSDANSYAWLMSVVLLTIPMLIIPLLTSFTDPREMLSSILWSLPALLISLQIVLLGHFTITQYYVIIQDDPEEKSDDGEIPTKSSQRQVNKEKFEQYIRQKRPYLNPRLKITDLCVDLATNRTYLSAFINKEYGMNFSQYINQLRLEEVQSRLNESPYLDNKNMEVILYAGFNSYPAYLQALKLEKQRKGDSTHHP